MGIMVLAGRELTAGQLIALAAPVGLSATNVKSHVSRMVSEGALEREGSARLAKYRMSSEQARQIEALRARLDTKPKQAWDGSWLMLTLQLPRSRVDRDWLRASLWFDGFRPVAPKTFLRPAWPLPWAEEQARQLSARTSGFCVRGVTIAAPTELGCLYDLRRLDSQARRLAAWIHKRNISSMSPRALFAERIKVGGQVVQLIGHDPRLPPSVWGQRRGLNDLVDAFLKFDKRVAGQAQNFVEEITGAGAALGSIRES